MASGWILWVQLEYIGVVSGCCCKEVYRQCSKLLPVNGQIPVNFRACLVKVQDGQSRCPDKSMRRRRSWKPRPRAIAQQRRGA